MGVWVCGSVTEYQTRLWGNQQALGNSLPVEVSFLQVNDAREQL